MELSPINCRIKPVITYGLLVLLLGIVLVGCGRRGGGRSDRGELIGVPGRKGWRMSIPFGMVYVDPGTFIMGPVDEDFANTQINFNKQITVGGFFMDQTEITNNEYRQFVYAVINGEEEGTSNLEGLIRNYSLLRDIRRRIFIPTLLFGCGIFRII